MSTPMEYKVPVRFLMRRTEGGPQGHSRVMLLGVAINAPAELPDSQLMMAQGTMTLSLDAAILAPKGLGVGCDATKLMTNLLGLEFKRLEKDGWSKMESCTPEPSDPDENG